MQVHRILALLCVGQFLANILWDCSLSELVHLVA
jgi:hypothetical protein